MNESLHLHEGEHLLCSMRPSASLLLASFSRGVLDVLAGGIVLLGILIGFWWFFLQDFPPYVLWIVPFLIVAILSAVVRYRTWKAASLRVTTERLLLESPVSARGTHLVTVKWSQYQESHAGKAGLLDLLFGARELCVRYGTADTEREVCFPSLRMADDLKHYLDKADSALRKGQGADLRPFIAKKKGQRD